MKLPRRNFLHLAAGAAALPAVPRLAWAEAYPSRPVRIIVPFAPAGTTDILARLIGQWLSERLGQQFVIENRPGASTIIGTEAVVRAPADGYTLLLATPSSAINATLFEKLSYNFLRDIAPVAGIMRVPNVMVVHPSVPAKSVPEFIAYAKANPGKINVESTGAGTSNHLAGELFKVNDWRRLGSYSVPRQRARANRSSRRSGAGRFRHHARLDRVHQGRQIARASGGHAGTFGSAAGHSDHERIRSGL